MMRPERVRDSVNADTHGAVTMILMGKDGGGKMRVPGDTPLREIFDRIDNMPMRQQEMRHNGCDQA